MLIPYRAKNPVKRFPVATVSIIGLNFIVYMLTTEYFLIIRESVLKEYGCLVGTSPIYTYITAMFLHAHPLHLIGNMVFLWVFGPSVEDRLGIPKYLGLYLVTGIVGALLQAAVSTAFLEGNLPGIGASGCIMGVVGAYWYMYSWSPIRCFYWVYWFLYGTVEIKAFWIISLYMLLNVLEGSLSSAEGTSGGVANFAHIGGAFAGALISAIMKVKRDSEEISEVKSLHSDAKDLDNMPLHALEMMITSEPDDPELLRALIRRAIKLGNLKTIRDAMMNAGLSLINNDPALVGYYIVDLRGDADFYRSVHLLRLAGILERNSDKDRANYIYGLIAYNRPDDPEAETALYRMAMHSWKIHGNAETAKKHIAELKNRYPHGEMVYHCNALLKKIG